MNPNDYFQSTPITNLKDAKQVIFDSLMEADRQYREVQIRRFKAIDDIVGDVDRTKLPMNAQRILWLMEFDGLVNEGQVNYLEGELNELRRR